MLSIFNNDLLQWILCERIFRYEPGADLDRVGISRSMHQMYPGQWVLGLYWDHGGGTVFFDRKDFDMLIIVDEPFSSKSIWSLDGLNT